MSDPNYLEQIAANQRLTPNEKLFIEGQLKDGRAIVDIMTEIAADDAQQITTLKAEASATAARSNKTMNQMRWIVGIIVVMWLLGMLLKSNIGR